MVTMTLSQLKVAHNVALNELIKEAGSPSHLAKMIEVTPNLVGAWIRRGRISLSGALAVADHPYLGKKFPIKKTRPELVDKDGNLK